MLICTYCVDAVCHLVDNDVLSHSLQINIHVIQLLQINMSYNTLHAAIIKGALYSIWCGVNRLSDSGVKVG